MLKEEKEFMLMAGEGKRVQKSIIKREEEVDGVLFKIIRSYFKRIIFQTM